MAKKTQQQMFGKPGEKSIDLNEAISSGLVSEYSDRGAARMAGLGRTTRLDYFKEQGAGPGIFKPESFYSDVDATYTNRILKLFGAKAKRGWAQRGTKKILAEQKKRTVEMRDTGRRELGEKKAASQRVLRVSGGLLAGASSPSLGESQTTGPMLGDDTMLGQQSMLGSRRRV
jgi:hypothetical protein